MIKGFRLAIATGLHQGDRPYQQDQVLVISHPRTPGCVLGVVADGMGGRSGGRQAAEQVMLTARQLFARYAPDRDDPARLLEQLLQDAHTVIKLVAISSEQEPHSTVAALLISPQGACTWAHSGDSRIYQFRRGRLHKRTRDHSYVQLLIDRGEISEAEANIHPQSNVLVSCLGMASNPPLIDSYCIPRLDANDVLLACSDGLWHYFTAEELGSVVAKCTPRDAVDWLVSEARLRARGSGDNLSLMIMKLEALPLT